MNNNKPEILSPVGYFDMLEAAVKSGADAVYFGAKEFSARRNAENFSDEEIQQAINYCHIRNVKAYLTLNILLKDSELESAFCLAERIYNMGIDGIIIQDLGLASIIHKYIPDLPLHASTQMSVHSPSALYILKKMGFCQVVAAREMSFKELKTFCSIANKLNIIVEVFVHGALCMCMSGQCLLSSFLGSRSGNRGLCAGPCRLPFSVENGTGYDLSLKDLSLIEYLTQLYNIGVTSFKIEGRMKRPEYVAAATAACRHSIDTGSINAKLSETLKNVFSRSGFTDGYYKSELGKNMFGIRTKEDVTSADNAFPEIHNLYRTERHTVKVNLVFKAYYNKETELCISDGENTVTVFGSIPEKALNKSTDNDSVFKNLNKFGSTPYYCDNANINLDNDIFIRSSEINDLRRRACALLDEKRCVLNHDISSTNLLLHSDDICHINTPDIYLRVENEKQLPDNFDRIKALIIPLELDLDIKKIPDMEFIVDIPRGIINESIIIKKLELFKLKGFKTALCGNLSAIEIAKKSGFNIIADTGINVLNSKSAETVKLLGAESVVISTESLLTDEEYIKCPIKKGIIAYGKIPLMIFKNCPLKNGIKCSDCDKNGKITDRKGIEFPIRCRMGYSELLNSVPIWLADKLDSIKNTDFIILYFTNEDKATVESTINNFKNKNSCNKKYTRGLYFRGTL